MDAILVPGGFGDRGIEGKIQAIRFARENNIPYLGICLGMQLAIIEYARNVLALKGANSTEFDRATNHPVIALITEWQDLERGQQVRDEKSDLGGSMRLGAQEAKLVPGSLARLLYGKESIFERHRHRYEFNNHYLDELTAAGLSVLGILGRRFGGVHRIALASLVRGEPISSGIHVDAARWASPVHGLRSGGPRVPRCPAARARDRMRLASFEVGPDRPFFLIAGPCVIESEGLVLDVAGRLKEITGRLGIPFIFKASFDKANRSSRASFRGPGIDAGLKALSHVREQIGVPVLTDVHEDTPLAEVAAVVDVLQTPAFLCRQTNFIVAAASQGKPVNIKKGQFLSPWEMQNVVDKARSTGNAQIMVCERGFSFGYNNLVSDMRSLAIMRGTGCPVVFDATHSVQLPGGKGDVSGGQREFVPVLARAAVAAGVAGIFMETHPDPAKALSDGPNAWPLDRMASLLATLKELDSAVKKQPFEESLL